MKRGRAAGKSFTAEGAAMSRRREVGARRVGRLVPGRRACGAWIAVPALILCLLVPARAEEPFAAKTATFDQLLFAAQRYGNTVEKRDQKHAAHDELFARRAESLKFLMGKVSIENIGIQGLVQELVENLKPEESAPVLAGFLAAEDPKTRKVAAYFLGFHETPDYADRVMPLLSDEETCGAAMRTLGKWRVQGAVTNLFVFLSHKKEVRRIAAVNALRDIGDPAAVPYLLQMLSDEVFTVREAAARALTAFGAAGEKGLLAALPGAREPARRHIIRALGEMRSRRALSDLRSLSGRDRDPFVRADAVVALEKIRAAH